MKKFFVFAATAAFALVACDKTAKGPYRTGYDASGNVTYYPGDIVADSKSKGIDYHMLACRFQVAF